MLVIACGAHTPSTPCLVVGPLGSRFLVISWGLAAFSLAAARRSITSPFSLFTLSFSESLTSGVLSSLSFIVSVSMRFICVVGDSIAVFGSTPSSAEVLWPSLRWQERECADMLGVFILRKRDRRSLFLPTLIGLAPLRRATPTSGFFEVSSSPVIGLCLRRLGSA